MSYTQWRPPAVDIIILTSDCSHLYAWSYMENLPGLAYTIPQSCCQDIKLNAAFDMSIKTIDEIMQCLLIPYLISLNLQATHHRQHPALPTCSLQSIEMRWSEISNRGYVTFSFFFFACEKENQKRKAVRLLKLGYYFRRRRRLKKRT